MSMTLYRQKSRTLLQSIMDASLLSKEFEIDDLKIDGDMYFL